MSCMVSNVMWNVIQKLDTNEEIKEFTKHVTDTLKIKLS